MGSNSKTKMDLDPDPDSDSIETTSVLLGYAEKEPTDDTYSHLGGKPTWLHPNSPPDARLAKCEHCGKMMSLLLQLNGEITESPHARMFYLFACRTKTCRWRKNYAKVLRAVMRSADVPEEPEGFVDVPKKEDFPRPEKQKVEAVQHGDFLFGGSSKPAAGSNPFSMGSTTSNSNPFSTNSTTSNANPFSLSTTTPTPLSPPPEQQSLPADPQTGTKSLTKSFAQALKLAEDGVPSHETGATKYFGPAEPWPEKLPHEYPLFHLDAEYEAVERTTGLKAHQLRKYERLMSQTGDDDDENEGGKSGQDNSTPSNDQIDDDVFQRFADRIANNPEQVLRYECGGTPLFYAVSDDVGRLLNPNDEGFLATRIPKCGNCGGSTRVFEFQIMPHAITVLEGDDEGFDGMDWGTIMAFTCKCVPKALDRNMVGYVEEHVSVQWEKQR
ncbi:unnamed protein product [Tuber melanosporum]|uniref:(Perigord truffle) hypothetical protein n=1 Tax=Tuber melanosporum (strain Mel28) TaxID=656061 RepID=D5G3X2_TUBMM|nr:uncharacterized protein GSTUM_00003839001 [Tuber melanosporum]CAZ79215.1 unnamed protein product [Tuber melanosporum]